MIYLLLLHFLSDFYFQDRDIADNKSKDFWKMGDHCVTVFITFYLGLLFLGPLHLVLGFSVCYALLHFLQDVFIWRSFRWWKVKTLKGAKYEFWKDKHFYDVIGLDQFLHIVTLIALKGLFS